MAREDITKLAAGISCCQLLKPRILANDSDNNLLPKGRVVQI